MKKTELELQSGFIADAIIDVKKKRFNEAFTTTHEVDIIRQIMQIRMNQKELNVKFVDGYFERIFNIINGIIMKDKDDSLKSGIGILEVRETLYDEEFLYLCLCEIMMHKIGNGIKHTCNNCITECCGELYKNRETNCQRWSYNFENKKLKEFQKILEMR